MKKPRISMIAAVGATTRVIGRNNELIWKLPGDLPRFKQLTSGHPVIMGRKTFESIGKPLPDRTNIVITHKYDFAPEGVRVVHSLDEALAEANLIEEEEIFIIGGGQIYNEALPFTDRLYLTLVQSTEEGDVFFPDYESIFTKKISGKEITDAEPHFSYVILEQATELE